MIHKVNLKTFLTQQLFSPLSATFNTFYTRLCSSLIYRFRLQARDPPLDLRLYTTILSRVTPKIILILFERHKIENASFISSNYIFLPLQ